MLQPDNIRYINSDRVQNVVNNKKTYYNAAVRNGIMLPPLNDPMITKPFLDEVRTKKVWLPKADECMGYTCVQKPTKLVLSKYLADALKREAQNADPKQATREERDAVLLLATRILENPPDAHFQLTILKKVEPDHFVFAKNYVRPRIKRGKQAAIFQIEDPDGFFEGLPEAPAAKRT